MISKEDIEHLKDLARVEFGEKETERLAKDLGEILGYIDELKNADVANVPEMTHALEGVKNIFRKDDSGDSPAIAGAPEKNNQHSVARELIDAFPEKHDSGHGIYLKVKSIL